MITGSTSTFPATMDDFGQLWVNNTCEKLTAAQLNTIQDIIYNLESNSQRLFYGASRVATDAGRPKMLMKTYSVTATGGASDSTQTVGLTGFTAAEKSLFDGLPLASGNIVIISVRLANQGVRETFRGYVGHHIAVSDYSGDSGWSIMIAPQIDNTSTGAAIGTPNEAYIITVEITKAY